MPTFNNVDSLKKYLLQNISKVLQNEVADAVKKEESNQVKKYYNEFTPDIYIRRKDSGGLSDIRNMVTRVRPLVNGVNLIIQNITPGNSKYGNHPNDQYIADIIYSGKGYQYHGRWSEYYERPRPINEDTVSELIRTRRHLSALVEGLQRLGIQCK